MCDGRLTVVLIEVGAHGGNGGFRRGPVVDKPTERVRRRLLTVGTTAFVNTSAFNGPAFR